MTRENLRLLGPLRCDLVRCRTRRMKFAKIHFNFCECGVREIDQDRNSRRTGRPIRLTRPYPGFCRSAGLLSINNNSKSRPPVLCCWGCSFAIVVLHNRGSTLVVIPGILLECLLCIPYKGPIYLCACVDFLLEGKLILLRKVLKRVRVCVADGALVSRYLTWLSIPTKTFNVGQYRRKGGNAHPPASFFDPNNQEGARQRELAAQEAFNDLLKWYSEGGVVAVLDATNSTRKRREWIQMKCSDAGICLMFVESVCESEELVLNNILDVKVSSPDYIGQDPEEVGLFPMVGVYADLQAALDFRDRIRLYEKYYETIDEDDVTWVKLINIGSQVIINRIQDFLQSRIVYYLVNLHIRPRSIYLSRVMFSTNLSNTSTENRSTIFRARSVVTLPYLTVVKWYPSLLALVLIVVRKSTSGARQIMCRILPPDSMDIHPPSNNPNRGWSPLQQTPMEGPRRTRRRSVRRHDLRANRRKIPRRFPQS